MAISDVPTTNSRHAFRNKVQEVVDVVNGLDPESDGPEAAPVLKTAVVNGTTAATNIAVSGITTSDEIQSAIAYTDGVPAIVTATIQSAGNIRISSDTTDKKVVVNWLDKTP